MYVPLLQILNDLISFVSNVIVLEYTNMWTNSEYYIKCCISALIENARSDHTSIAIYTTRSTDVVDLLYTVVNLCVGYRFLCDTYP